MRKSFVKAALFIAAVVLFASCEKVQPTALNKEDALAVSSICGHVRYAYVDDDNKTTYQIATAVSVRIESEVEIEKPDTSYKATAVYIVETDGKGFYTVDVAVPMGKTAKCKVMTNFDKKSYATNLKGDKSEVTCNFEAIHDNVAVNYGQKVVKNLEAANAGVVSAAGF